MLGELDVHFIISYSITYTRSRLHTVPLIGEHQAMKLRIPIFIAFGLTRPGIEPKSTDSVADALSTNSPLYETVPKMFLLVSTGAGIKSCLAVIVCLTLKVGLTMISINTYCRAIV